MAVAFRAAALYGNGTGTSVAGVNTDVTATTGDYLVAELYKENDAAVTVTPSDWVLVEDRDQNDAGGSFHSYTYTRKFTSGDANPNFSWTGSAWRDLLFSSHSGSTGTGADGTDGHNGQVGASAGTSVTCPSYTTAIDQDIDLLIAYHFAGGTYTYPAGWTERAGDNRDCGLATKAGIGVGSQASQTVTLGTSSTWVGVHLAIKNADASAAVQQTLGLTGVGR